MLTAALAGACFGFLPHNFFPARMFMGDSGALLIGFMLACSTISLTGQFSTTTHRRGLHGADASLLPALLPLILPFAVLDRAVRRHGAGRRTPHREPVGRPFSPDKKHLHHRLLEIGHSQRRAVVVMYLWAGLVAFGVVVISLFSGWWSALGLTVDGDRRDPADVRRARTRRDHQVRGCIATSILGRIAQGSSGSLASAIRKLSGPCATFHKRPPDTTGTALRTVSTVTGNGSTSSQGNHPRPEEFAP